MLFYLITKSGKFNYNYIYTSIINGFISKQKKPNIGPFTNEFIVYYYGSFSMSDLN